MKYITSPRLETAGKLALALALMSSVNTARANVYATDIQVNGNLYGLVASTHPTPATPATITYHINDASATSATVTILNGTTTVATIIGGSAFGLNTVQWGGTNNAGAAVPAGVAYSINIAATATGYSAWTQISVDGPNTTSVYGLGMDVDKNTNSPWYGRVVVGNAGDFTANGVTQKVGLYKANADGTPADEGAFGYANYSTNDSGNIGTGEMSYEGGPYHNYQLPFLVRIASDDRTYFDDVSGVGAIIATDMQATTNQIVICEGPGNASEPGTKYGFLAASVAFPTCPNNYANVPGGGDLNYYGIGWGNFDVAGFETGHPALYLDDWGDYPSLGVWMYHMTNGAADSADIVGTQAIAPDDSTIFVSGSGISVDTNLDLFFGQHRSNAADPLNRVFLFDNWNGGVLPPEGDGANGTYVVQDEEPTWAIGSSSALTDLNDTVINSRLNPTLAAVASLDSAVTVLSAVDGSTVTTLDAANGYTSAAFDGVGNVYGCSTTANYWRAWSPPGANSSTTLSVAQVIIPTPIVQITSSAVVPSGDCSTVTIRFTTTANLPTSDLVLLSSGVVNGTYTPVSGATITTVSPGVYQATATVCSSIQFFQVEFQFPYAN